MGGRGARSATGRGSSYFQKETIDTFLGGNLPEALPGTKFPDALKAALDEIAASYIPEKEMLDYFSKTFANGKPHLEVKEEGSMVRIRVGNVTGRASLPDFELAPKQKEAFINFFVRNAYLSAKRQGLL